MADFYIDNDVATQVANELRKLGHQAVATRNLQLSRSSDAEQLLTAATNRWILATHNKRDFILLQRAWRLWSQAWQVTPVHQGILILPQRQPAPVLARLLDLHVSSAEPLENMIYEYQGGKGWVHLA